MKTPTMQVIAETVCRLSNHSLQQIRCRTRKRVFVNPRQVICYLARDMRPDLTVSQIGRFMHRDHTTVCHSIAMVQHACAGQGRVELALLANAARRELGTIK